MAAWRIQQYYGINIYATLNWSFVAWRLADDCGMYSGLLPKDVAAEELSPDEDEDDQEEDGEGRRERAPGKSHSAAEQSIPEANTDHNFPTCGLPGVSKEMWQVCRFGGALANAGAVSKTRFRFP